MHLESLRPAYYEIPKLNSTWYLHSKYCQVKSIAFQLNIPGTLLWERWADQFALVCLAKTKLRLLWNITIDREAFSTHVQKVTFVTKCLLFFISLFTYYISQNYFQHFTDLNPIRRLKQCYQGLKSFNVVA